jgi:hypothetical protein
MRAGLVGGEGFAIDASVIEADASSGRKVDGKLTTWPETEKLLYGFGGSFLPILLKDSGVLLGFYFTPFAAVMLGSRFFLMKHLQKLPKPLLLSAGMVSLSLSAMLPVFALNTETIIGSVRLSSDVKEIKLVFSIPRHRPTPRLSLET